MVASRVRDAHPTPLTFTWRLKRRSTEVTLRPTAPVRKNGASSNPHNTRCGTSFEFNSDQVALGGAAEPNL
jgi:hypothetical protein